jgi:hypothetical protein
MSRFELSKGVRDLNSILDEYRPRKWRGNSAEYLNSDAIATPLDHQPAHPVEGDDIEPANADSHYPARLSLNSPTFNLQDHDQPSRSRLDDIADALRTLTYGDMLELAESMWKVNSQGSDITESDLPNLLYRWSKSRSIET